jgi:tRNA nucleotidyltransferase (CCA-adding enzyme)
MDKLIYTILEKLESNGFEAYIVGGYVRDHIMNKSTSDIDITTSATPKEVVKIFKNCDVKFLEYGNVLIKTSNYQFDITTYRKDIKYINNRKPVEIVYIDSLEDDIRRRDFTINTLCMNKDDKITDILNGKKDIKNKLVKAVGDPYKKLEEDSLRIMRAVRFATTLNFKLDKDLKDAIIKNKELLRNLSYERKKDELTKIFTSKNKKYGINLLRNLGLLEPLELHNIESVLLTKNPLGMWSNITEVYPFNKNEKAIIASIRALMGENLKDKKVLYKYGLYPISIVCDLKKLNKKKYVNFYEKLPIKDKNEIDITCADVCDNLNIEPGSILKDIYLDLENKILNGELKNKKSEIKKYLIKQYS